jgi:hypothetical protein
MSSFRLLLITHRPKPLPQAIHGFGVVHANQHLVTFTSTLQRPVLVVSCKLKYPATF